LPGRLVDVGPTTRQRPAPVVAFADHQYAPIAKCRTPDIDPGRRIAGVLAKQVDDLLGGNARAHRHHLGSENAQAFVALSVVFVLGVKQAGLRHRLQLARKAEPSRVGGAGHRCPDANRAAIAFRDRQAIDLGD